MNENTIYSSIIKAKSGEEIPVLKSGKTIESKYNPAAYNKNLLDSQKNSAFFLLTGLSSGILPDLLIKKFPDSKILILEPSEADFTFLKQIKTVLDLENNNQIVFCTIQNLKKTIISSYIPALYGDFKVIRQTAWLQENEILIPSIEKEINNALKIISADYSVQCHFGKIWQKNIINNLKTAINKNLIFPEYDKEKTAAVIAAGPSLDSSINELKKNRNEYIIFSTDTAYSSLLQQNIIPEYVISIDGQQLSSNHFFKISEKTTFIFDLCGNNSAVQQIIKQKGNIYFFVSGHPFCTLLNKSLNYCFSHIFNGSGTVTISALDLALKAGYRKIKIFGADFSYINGKAYTKGTYLSRLYSIGSDRIFTEEQSFDKLMYRTPLINLKKNSCTTEILTSYKLSLEDYLKQNECSFQKNDYIYEIFSKKEKTKFKNIKINQSYDFIISQIQEDEMKSGLLPFIAYLRTRNPQSSFTELLKLARGFVVSYN